MASFSDFMWVKRHDVEEIFIDGVLRDALIFVHRALLYFYYLWSPPMPARPNMSISADDAHVLHADNTLLSYENLCLSYAPRRYRLINRFSFIWPAAALLPMIIFLPIDIHGLARSSRAKTAQSLFQQ